MLCREMMNVLLEFHGLIMDESINFELPGGVKSFPPSKVPWSRKYRPHVPGKHIDF